MAVANIHDRASIEHIYPPAAFARDAAQNDRAKAEVLHGVRVASAPDETGNFALEPASHHAGGVPGAVFLAPFRSATAADPDRGYAAFLDEIVDNAKLHGYRAETSPGPGDRRIRGLRQ